MRISTAVLALALVPGAVAKIGDTDPIKDVKTTCFSVYASEADCTNDKDVTKYAFEYSNFGCMKISDSEYRKCELAADKHTCTSYDDAACTTATSSKTPTVKKLACEKDGSVYRKKCPTTVKYHTIAMEDYDTSACSATRPMPRYRGIITTPKCVPNPEQAGKWQHFDHEDGKLVVENYADKACTGTAASKETHYTDKTCKARGEDSSKYRKIWTDYVEDHSGHDHGDGHSGANHASGSLAMAAVASVVALVPFYRY